MADDGYGKYRKMLKMGIPRQQVNTSMLMDGKDPSKFSEQDPNEAPPPSDGDGLDLTFKGDKYDKYRKMLKCGLPMGAALHAMAKDGVDPKGFDASSSAPTETAPTAATPPATPPAAESESNGATGGGGGFLNELKMRSEAKSASPPVITKPAATVVSAASPEPISSSGGGGGLLQELKMRSERRLATQSEPPSTSPASMPTKSISPPLAKAPMPVPAPAPAPALTTGSFPALKPVSSVEKPVGATSTSSSPKFTLKPRSPRVKETAVSGKFEPLSPKAIPSNSTKEEVASSNTPTAMSEPPIPAASTTTNQIESGTSATAILDPPISSASTAGDEQPKSSLSQYIPSAVTGVIGAIKSASAELQAQAQAKAAEIQAQAQARAAEPEGASGSVVTSVKHYIPVVAEKVLPTKVSGMIFGSKQQLETSDTPPSQNQPIVEEKTDAPVSEEKTVPSTSDLATANESPDIEEKKPAPVDTPSQVEAVASSAGKEVPKPEGSVPVATSQPKKWEIPSKAVPTPPVNRIQPPTAVSSKAMEEILNETIAENEDKAAIPTVPEVVAPVAATAPEPKRWTPPVKASTSASNPSDWRGLLAKNKISVPVSEDKKADSPTPKAEATSAPVAPIEAKTTAVESTKSPEPVKPQFGRSSPAPSNNDTAKASVTSKFPVKTASPPGGPRIPQYPSTFFTGQKSAAAPEASTGSTLKKRHSNDWRAELAPFVEKQSTNETTIESKKVEPSVASGTANASVVPQVHSNNVKPAESSPVVASTSSTSAVSTVPQSVKPAPTSAPVPAGSTLQKRHSNDWRAQLAPYMEKGGVNKASEEKQTPTPPSTDASATSNTSSTVNSLGLNKTAEKRLPAWAVVEKPSFLMNRESVNISSQPRTTPGPVVNTPVVSAPQKTSPIASPVPKAEPVKPVVAPSVVKSDATAKSSQPVKTYSTVPKGLQRKFAWEQ